MLDAMLQKIKNHDNHSGLAKHGPLCCVFNSKTLALYDCCWPLLSFMCTALHLAASAGGEHDQQEMQFAALHG
jgi:hypothetical protein